MDFRRIEQDGLVLLGCGKMGSAMLAGWLSQGLRPDAVSVLDPAPSEWLQSTGVRINDPLPSAPAAVIIAVKPQMMGDALPSLQAISGGGTVFVSIAAGTPIERFEASLPGQAAIIRAMPNTPAAVGRGITAIVGNDCVTAAQLDLAEALLSSVGQVVRLGSEAQMDAVTAVSGSGPAYVFHLIETLAAAGVAEGLPRALSEQLAKATVVGAGALAETAQEGPAQLRKNVTSPGGTTQAALEVLMDENAGFPALLKRAVKAAANRSKELSDG